MIVRSPPATNGASTLPMLEPKPCMEMAKPRRSGNRRERAAVDGRCHSAPGTETMTTAIVRTNRLGEAANTAMTYGYDSVTQMQETKCSLCQIELA